MNLSDGKWMRRFMGVAAEVATWSKDTTTVGAIIVSSEGLILSTGYNGIARGVRDDDERMARPANYPWVCHGEEAAIANAARHGVRTSGSVLFCTHSPCGRCARQIINAGIRRVYVGEGQTSMPADEFEAAAVMFAEAGVEVISLEMGDV